MKRLLVAALITLSLPTFARIYYTSPSGNDNNAGTITAPWFTLQKAWTVVAAGDTVYMRGGTYVYSIQQGLTGKNGTALNMIKVWAYPGERPAITRGATFSRPYWHRSGVFFSGNYVHFKGIEIYGFPNIDGNIESGLLAYNSNNNTFEQLNIHDNHSGMYMEGSCTGNLILNSDFHDNYDPQSNGGNSDGLATAYMPALTSTTTIKGCRAWNNGDDGIDNFENSGFVLIDSCWSWHNGYIKGSNTPAGDGVGFKLGSDFLTTPAGIGVVKRRLQRSLAFDNDNAGAHINEADFSTEIFNNIFFRNQITGLNFHYNNRVHYFRNNVSFGNTDKDVEISGNSVRSNNSAGTAYNDGGWTLNASAADFLSIDTSVVRNPRQADGSLPNINFLKFSSSSDLIDQGLNVGLPYNGTAPDRGAYEYGVALPNLPPSANAGTDKTITLPTNTITQTGSGTDPDGSIAAYQWTKISGPATFTIVSPSQATTVINNVIQGVYQFELQVTDNLGATAKDTMTLTVNAGANQSPTANAGANQTITLPTNTVTVTGSGTDPDGSIASYLWTKIAGPATFTIISPAQASTAINSLVQGTYQFELRVTDNLGAIGRDTMIVTVNAANITPTANAGANQTITLPTNTVTVTGSGTDPDGSIASYLWTKIAGPATFTIVSPAQASSAINSLVQGTYQFELRVTDNLGAIGRDTMIVTVNAANIAPVANAGADQIITLPTSAVTVTGSGTDADGSIASYQWTKIAGPATFTIVSPTQAQTTINNLVQGTYQFELRVTDNSGAIGRDTMAITVNPVPNQPPVANAGADQTITLPANAVSLNGAATDADGTITTYQWAKISGPATFTIVSPSAAQTTVNGLIQGIYVFRFTVTDNSGASATDDIIITVNAAPNQSPVANAGADKSITLPANSLTVTGSGSDPDGSIVSYQWTKIAGPATFSLATPTQAQTLISNLVQGTYQFEFRVTDNLGAIGRDTMTVTVNAAPNQSPVANAGIDRTITLPTNSLTVSGSGTDPDGSIASYQWTKIGGPATFTIGTPAQAQTLISNLVQGVYQFELRVTDNLGAIGRDTMTITVNAAPNQLPTANAGPNQTITLPVNTVTVTGSGSDPDGSITAYQWTKISGPATFTIVSPNQAQSVINNLVQGTYVFRLTVTDNSGATADAFVTITVNSTSNQSPTANAGNDQVITLPLNSVTVTGSGTDPDGSIASYAWTKISGPASGVIANPAQAQTIINSLTQGTYVFSLTVTDNSGATGIDYITITVNPAANQAPIANAGTDQTITLPLNSVTLIGSGTDADGNIVSYSWTKISGPATFSINTPTQAQTTVTNLVQGVYVFRLTVMDNTGADADAFVTITVNAAPNQLPVANAGTDQAITLPLNTVTLSGSATDPDGSIVSYLWTKISGPATFVIVSPSQAQTVINNLVQGVYVFRLTVMDNSGANADAFVTITVNAAPNLPPVANAGSDRTITLPTNSLTLTGSGSDPDGTITAYLWNKISGPAQFVILSPAQPQTIVNNLIQGTYQFELRVTDNQGSTGRDTITVIVNPAPPANQPPVANAGNNQTITLPVNSVTLTGSGTDADGSIASYQWNKIAGPASFTMATPAQAQTVINNLVQGTYQFELTVADNLGATGKDTVTVTVNPAPVTNQPPVANAGNNQSITLPVNSVNILGSGTDADGSIASYQWTKISGPATFSIVFPSQAQTTINNLVEGTYQFELRVTDNQGAIGRDTMSITVNPVPNVVPVANAGPDRTMTLPTNAISQTGGATDSDGTIASYLWRKVAGPAQYTIETPNQAQTIFSNLEEGVYQFELTVTDNRGGTDRDTINVTVRGSSSLLKQVYPNPATDQINININAAGNARTSLVLNVYDSRGVSVYYKQLPIGQTLITETVDLTKLADGMYIIEVMADGAKRSTMKFVKQ